MLSFGYSKILLPLVLVILLGSSNVKSQSIVGLLSSILESLESIENILEQYHPQTITHVSPNWLADDESDIDGDLKHNLLINNSIRDETEPFAYLPDADNDSLYKHRPYIIISEKEQKNQIVNKNELDRSSLNQIIKITEAKNGFNGKDLNYGIKLENGKYIIDKSNKKKFQSKLLPWFVRSNQQDRNARKNYRRGTIVINQNIQDGDDEPAVTSHIVVENADDMKKANDIITNLNDSLLKQTGISIPTINARQLKSRKYKTN